MAAAEFGQFRCHRSTTAAAATAAGPPTASRSAASFALPSGEHLPRGPGAKRDADVSGRNQPAEDLRCHFGHVSEDVRRNEVCTFLNLLTPLPALV